MVVIESVLGELIAARTSSEYASICVAQSFIGPHTSPAHCSEADGVLPPQPAAMATRTTKRPARGCIGLDQLYPCTEGEYART
jgi:hypothetical protein